ncbi:class I SAM-dependent methyltransferase [Stenotrophomonas maltophilia]|nr:class I SAM-dependent methyltransferase [Stenotrophomonas maltophilia]MBH1600875.1 class I SAM-dependent methyltransferase [Stenotrophomonas maltophilia]
MIELNNSAFIRPLKLPPSAWHGHIPFAGWITEALRPAMFVELGTHYGASYLSFCQTIQELGLDSRAYAVDTWEGDEHAAFYGNSVYAGLSEYHDSKYDDFSKLLRCTFDQALGKFEDGSVDLLHIDGLHTYEAVRHDFESWKPKLSSRAVVLFHDTQERQGDFGVWRLWAELSSQYPSFEFRHSHGLGVLVVGENAPDAVKALGTLDGHQRNLVTHLFAALGHAVAMAYARDWWRNEVHALGGKVANLEGELAYVRAEHERSIAAVNEKTQQLHHAGEQLAALQGAADDSHGRHELATAIAALEAELESAEAERDVLLRKVEEISHNLGKEREQAVAAQAECRAKVLALAALEAEKASALAALEAEKASALAALEADKSSALAALEVDRASALAALEADKASALAALEADKASALAALEGKIAQEREAHAAVAASLEAERAAHQRSIAAHESESALRLREREQGLQEVGMRRNRLLSDIKDRDDLIASLTRDLHQAQQRSETIGAKVGRAFERIHQRWNAQGGLRARALNWGIRKAEARYARSLGREQQSAGGVALTRPQAGFNPALRADCQDLADYIGATELSPQALAEQAVAAKAFTYRPRVSLIIPIYKVPRQVLDETLQSVELQTYGEWETCLAWADVDDLDGWEWLKQRCASEPRHKAILLAANGGISENSNAALEHAEGEFVALLDHDDTITPWALYDMVAALQQGGADVDFLYSDKDSINADGTCRMNALYKPQWSPEMLHSVNYLTHLNLMRTSVVRQVGAWDKETDGAQDWDIFFRVTSAARRIVHVPSIHYHWRILPTSTASGLQTKPYAIMGQLRTQKNYFASRGLPAQVKRTDQGLFHITWPKLASASEVVVIQHGTAEQLVHTLNLLLVSDLSSISRIHAVHVGEAGAELQAFANLPDSRFVLRRQDAFTWSAVADWLDASSAGVVLIDGRAVGLSEGLLNELLGWVHHHPDIAWTSALAVSEDGRVVEAGRVVAADGSSAPLFNGAHPHEYGWFGGAQWYRNMRAASPFAIAFKMTKFQTVSRFLGGDGEMRHAFTRICTGSIESGGGRGLIDPFAVVYMPPGTQAAWSNDGEQYRDDPYFNPAFRQVSPLRLNK